MKDSLRILEIALYTTLMIKPSYNDDLINHISFNDANAVSAA